MNNSVLVVEDDHSVAYMLQRALNSAGLDVRVAADGLAGWQEFEARQPDLVISDIRMPLLDGVELLQRIKHAAPEIDVILLTGHGELSTAKQAVALGAYSYLEKPISQIRDLVQQVERALEKRQLARDRALIDRISLDLSRRLYLPSFLNRFVDHLRQAFPQIDAVFISLDRPHDDGLTVLFAHGVDGLETLVGSDTRSQWSIGARAYASLQVVTLDGRQMDWESDPGRQILARLPRPLQDMARANPTLGVVGIPFVSKDRAIGSLAVANLQSLDNFDSHLTDLLAILCRQVGLYLDNARLVNDLQAQTGRLEAVLASTLDGMIVIDPTGRVMMTNPSYASMLSRGAGPDLDAQERLIQTLRSELSDQESTSFVISVEHPASDTPTLLEVQATHVRQGGNSLGMVANLRDVTRLYGVDQQRGHILRRASHEIGTPLDAISAYARILHGDASIVPDEQRGDILRMIDQQAQEIKELVKQTLDYSQVKEQMLLRTRERVNLSHLASEMAQQYSPLVMQKRVQLSCQIEPDLWVEGQTQALRQAFRNLLENARKFTPPGGVIQWSAFRDAHTVKVVVADNGVGIPPDELDDIFDIYYRASSAGDVQGSGLGLSIVQDIIEIHRGKIEVESAEGEGTHFTVTLAALSDQD